MACVRFKTRPAPAVPSVHEGQGRGWSLCQAQLRGRAQDSATPPTQTPKHSVVRRAVRALPQGHGLRPRRGARCSACPQQRRSGAKGARDVSVPPAPHRFDGFVSCEGAASACPAVPGKTCRVSPKASSSCTPTTCRASWRIPSPGATKDSFCINQCGRPAHQAADRARDDHRDRPAGAIGDKPGSTSSTSRRLR